MLNKNMATIEKGKGLLNVSLDDVIVKRIIYIPVE